MNSGAIPTRQVTLRLKPGGNQPAPFLFPPGIRWWADKPGEEVEIKSRFRIEPAPPYSHPRNQC